MDVEARAFAMMSSTFAVFLIWHLVMRFVSRGWHDCLVMAAIQQPLSFSQRRCSLWTPVSLITGGAFSLSEAHDLTPVLAGIL